MKRNGKLFVCLTALLTTAAAAATFAACDETNEPVDNHTHALTPHAATPADCTHTGTEAYWECADCGLLFSDSEGETQIDAPVTTPVAHGALSETEEVSATCTAGGTAAYWTCDDCGALFSDAAGEHAIDAPASLSANGHAKKSHDGKSATCTEAGYEAYWECTACEKLFSDEACEHEISAAVPIPAAHGALTETEAVAATCLTDGVAAYWTCGDCGQKFSDAEGTTKINTPATLDATGHADGEKTYTHKADTTLHIWKCSNAGCEGEEESCEYDQSETREHCNEAGTLTSTCKYCDDVVTASLAAGEHAYGNAKWTWTEEDGGYTATVSFTCTKEDDTQTPAVTVTSATTKNVTCTADGTLVYTAKVTFKNKEYQDTKTVTLTHEGHKGVEKAAKAATCTEDGNLAYWQCSACEKLFSDEACESEYTESVVINALGHNGTKKDAKAASCTEVGYEAYWECGACSKLFSDEACEHEIAAPVTVPAAHKTTAHDKVDSTCTTEGSEAYWQCTVCEKLFSDEACEHEIDAPVAVPAAHKTTAHNKVDSTCTTLGNEAYWQCTVCEKLFSDEACEHEIDAPISIALKKHTATQVAASATCLEQGYEAHWHCTVCDKNFTSSSCVTEKTLTKAYGKHTYVYAQSVHAQKSATCTETGIKTYYECTTCHKKFTQSNFYTVAYENATPVTDESLVIAALGHNVSLKAAKTATCTADGNIAYYQCSRTDCKKYFSDSEATNEITQAQTVTTKLGHVTNPTHFEAVASTCTTMGTAECWYCSQCKKYFTDEAMTTTANSAKPSVAFHPNAQSAKPADSKALTTLSGATLTFPGADVYHCPDCDPSGTKYFAGSYREFEVTGLYMQTNANYGFLMDSDQISVGAPRSVPVTYQAKQDGVYRFTLSNGQNSKGASATAKISKITYMMSEAAPQAVYSGSSFTATAAAYARFKNDSALTDSVTVTMKTGEIIAITASTVKYDVTAKLISEGVKTVQFGENTVNVTEANVNSDLSVDNYYFTSTTADKYSITVPAGLAAIVNGDLVADAQSAQTSVTQNFTAKKGADVVITFVGTEAKSYTVTIGKEVKPTLTLANTKNNQMTVSMAGRGVASIEVGDIEEGTYILKIPVSNSIGRGLFYIGKNTEEDWSKYFAANGSTLGHKYADVYYQFPQVNSLDSEDVPSAKMENNEMVIEIKLKKGDILVFANGVGTAAEFGIYLEVKQA